MTVLQCALSSCNNSFTRKTCQKYCSVDCRINDRKCCTCKCPIPSDQSGTKNRLCRDCDAAYQRGLRLDPLHKAKSVSRIRSRLFGISEVDYLKMVETQNGRCAICGNPEMSKRRGVIKTLAVDHDHKTGNIRGLLCSLCNTAIGSMQDNPARLRAAAEYLERR